MEQIMNFNGQVEDEDVNSLIVQTSILILCRARVLVYMD